MLISSLIKAPSAGGYSSQLGDTRIYADSLNTKTLIRSIGPGFKTFLRRDIDTTFHPSVSTTYDIGEYIDEVAITDPAKDFVRNTPSIQQFAIDSLTRPTVDYFTDYESDRRNAQISGFNSDMVTQTMILYHREYTGGLNRCVAYRKDLRTGAIRKTLSEDSYFTYRLNIPPCRIIAIGGGVNAWVIPKNFGATTSLHVIPDGSGGVYDTDFSGSLPTLAVVPGSPTIWPVGGIMHFVLRSNIDNTHSVLYKVGAIDAGSWTDVAFPHPLKKVLKVIPARSIYTPGVGYTDDGDFTIVYSDTSDNIRICRMADYSTAPGRVMVELMPSAEIASDGFRSEKTHADVFTSATGVGTLKPSGFFYGDNALYVSFSYYERHTRSESSSPLEATGRLSSWIGRAVPLVVQLSYSDRTATGTKVLRGQAWSTAISTHQVVGYSDEVLITSVVELFGGGEYAGFKISAPCYGDVFYQLGFGVKPKPVELHMTSNYGDVGYTIESSGFGHGHVTTPPSGLGGGSISGWKKNPHYEGYSSYYGINLVLEQIFSNQVAAYTTNSRYAVPYIYPMINSLAVLMNEWGRLDERDTLNEREYNQILFDPSGNITAGVFHYGDVNFGLTPKVIFSGHTGSDGDTLSLDGLPDLQPLGGLFTRVD